MINVNDIPAVRALVEQQAGASSSGTAPAAAAPVQGGAAMVQVAELPAVRALLEQEQSAPAAPLPTAATPQYVRAPEGNGHEVAVRQQGGAR